MSDNEGTMETPHDQLASETVEDTGPPVFVDATGRRARRIERLAALVVLACLGYGLALLIAAVTGVPIDGAIVPYPDLGASPHASHPAPSQVPSVVNGAAQTHRPSATVTPSPSAGATAHPAAGTTSSAVPTKAATHPTGHPTSTSTATPTHGNSTAAPGATHRPTAKPTVAHTPTRPAHP